MEIISSAWFWWLVVAIVLFVVELMSGTSIAFCMAVGCAAAMLASFTKIALQWQIVIAIIISVICFLFVFIMPASKRNRKHTRNTGYASNMDALIGRKTTVIETIKGDGQPGRIKIDGDVWQAVTEDGQSLENGSLVEVTGYDSIILKVKPIQ